MKETSSEDQSEHSYFGDEIDNMESDQNKNNIDFSKTSSNPECVLDNVNKKIKSIIENGKDLSYSNSNSKISDHFQNKEQFLYSQYWLTKKKSNNDTDSSSAIIENKKNQKIKEKDEEKILYNSDEEENNINNINNKFDDDDFDEEDMEEKTIEKKENDINEINSIKVNNNNLNNKDNLSLTNNSNSNNDLKQINPNNNINSNINNINLNTNINEKINTINTPSKLSPPQTPNTSFMPYLYNTNQVHSFISSYNNYPSNLSKGSFISTNNSSNTKFKKNEEHSEIEEEEIKLNNNSIFTHGNKFGPHLIDYSHLQSNTINLEQNNLNSINSINSFNMSNNFLYNRIPKMNLNMVYYIPIQQQAIPTNNNYINNNKIITNLNNNINSNENINNNININLQNQNKENNTEVNNNIINNKNGNGNNNSNNNNGNKISKKEKEKEKEKENSNSKEKKTKNKSQNINSNQNLNTNNNINNINNFRNNNNTNNSTNYKNNPNYKPNDNNHSSNPISINLSSTNTSSNITQGNKCEKNLLNLDDIVTGKDTRTTVMIRNIPIKYTDSILIKDLEEFKGKYDCLYMPYDYEKKGNKGYAFINFVNPLHILYFHEKFNGKKWPLFESSKICELNSANFQGIYEIQKHSKNYKGYKKPLFYSEPNKNSSNKENIVIPSKYLNKLKVRFPKIKFKENKAKKIITVDSFE